MLFADEQLRSAAMLSLEIARLSATVLGTVAGFWLARFRGFRSLRGLGVFNPDHRRT